MSSESYTLEPPLTLADVPPAGADWSTIDRVAAEVLGRPCVAVPSVRVGLAWTLDHLGLRRQRDHMVVPRFTSRCILNSLGRYVLPVEGPTERTRAVLAVHQYGLGQELAAIGARCAERGWLLIEDAACGPTHDETRPLRSHVRFIGLTKTLPVMRGAVAITDDAPLADALRRQRARGSAWSYPVLLALWLIRRRHRTSGSSELAEIAYEAYHAAGGGDRWTRGNLLCGLRQLHAFGAEATRRQARALEALGPALLVASDARTPYVGCYMPGALDGAVTAFHAAGFMAEPHHVDVARNVLSPRYERSLLLPFNPRIPASAYEALIRGVSRGG